MILIEDFRPGKDSVNGAVYLFNVRVVHGNEYLRSKGWRYFVETDSVKPPAARAGKGAWSPTVDVSAGFEADVSAAVQRTLAPGSGLAAGIWDAYQGLVTTMDPDEALAAVTAIEDPSEEQKLVRMLLYAAANGGAR